MLNDDNDDNDNDNDNDNDDNDDDDIFLWYCFLSNSVDGWTCNWK